MATVAEQIQKVYIGLLGRAADKSGLDYWTNEIDSGVLTLEQLRANIVNEQPEYQQGMGSMTRAQLVNALYQNLFNRSAEADGLDYWVNGGGAGVNADQLVLALINGASAADTLALDNKTEVAQYYTQAAGADYVPAEARSAVDDVDGSSDLAAAKAAVDAELSDEQAYTLTNDIDVAEANVFTSTPVYTPEGNDFINSLQDEDELTGTGDNPTLNVTLGSVNDAAEGTIAPVLNNIQTVNVKVTGDAMGINFQDATGLEALNVERVTQTNAQIAFEDLDVTTDSLSLANATRDGDITFDYREDTLTGTDEVLDVALSNARLSALTLSEGNDSGEDAGYFFETVNVNVDGASNIDELDISANAEEDLLNGTDQTVNVVADADLEVNDLTAEGAEFINVTANADVMIAADEDDVLSVGNDGISTDELQTLTITGAGDVTIDGLDGDLENATLTVAGAAMTGDLTLGVQEAADADASSVFANRADVDVDITSGSGDDEIETYTGLAGNITTNDGADAVTVGGDVEGVSAIDTGTGNDSVATGDLNATANDENDGNSSFGEVTAASVATGEGDDTVTVGALNSEQDWDHGVLNDGNADDVYNLVGASVDTGAGDDTLALDSVAEGASANTGEGNDTVNVELGATGTILEGDNGGALIDAREVDTNGDIDTQGAVLTLGAGDDSINFTEVDPGQTAYTLVGRDALLDAGAGADELNVSALDDVTVAAATSLNADDAAAEDTNATITGVETANLTVENQVDAATETATGATENDADEDDGAISADVMRFDDALDTINLTSNEQALLQDPATEVYEAGTETAFELQNLRAGITTTLTAHEATGVDGSVGTTADGAAIGGLEDDTQLSIDAATGVVTQDGDASDVALDVDMVAEGTDDTFTLEALDNGEAFDLDLTMGATSTSQVTADGDNTTENRVENVVINFADAESHSVNLNGFGDYQFDEVDGSTDSVVNVDTSLTINTAAGAGERIDLDNVEADTIRVMNDAAATAADVTLRVTADNYYDIVTGAGNDILDLQADDVRSDDLATAVDRADHIDAGEGRDTLVVSGDDNLGVNNVAAGTPATVIDDDVFETLSGIEVLTSNTDAGAGTQDITLNEAAKETGVDTINLSGSAAQNLNVVFGNDFSLNDSAADNDNQTEADSAFVLDASRHTAQSTLTVESKDDDTDVDRLNLDLRANLQAGLVMNIVDTGDEDATAELRLTTSATDATQVISNGNAGNADGLADINVDDGSLDKIVLVDGSTDSNANGEGDEGLTVTIADEWTRDSGSFEFDASAIGDDDADTTTGGATITVEAGDNAELTLHGTQNDDTITGGAQDDTINGNDGDDTLNGMAGADTINGGLGDDIIDGGSGADTIDGGEGDDDITGGLGADDLTGGEGADNFNIDAVNESTQSSADSISDFETGTDTITVTQTVANGSTVNLGRFSVEANSGDGDNSLDGTNTVNVLMDAYYSETGQLAIDVDGDGDITDVNDIVVNSVEDINAGDLNYSITAAGGDNTVRLGQGVDTITTGGGNDSFTIVGSLDAGDVAAYNAAGAGVVGGAADVVEYNDLLSTRSVSEANAGDSIDAGAGNDALHVFGTVDLTAVTLTDIDTLTVHSDVTLTLDQLNALDNVVFAGDTPHELTVVDANNIYGNGSDYELTQAQINVALGGKGVYVINDGANTTFTVGSDITTPQTAAQFDAAVGFDALDDDSADSAAVLFSLGQTGYTIDDTYAEVIALDAAVLQAANSVTAHTVNGDISGDDTTDIDALELANNATVTLTEAQHAQVTSTNVNETVTLAAVVDGLTLSLNVAQYNLAAGTNTVAVGSTGVNISETGAGGETTIQVDGTYTGTFTDAGTADAVELADGADISGATNLDVATATLAGDATISDAQHDAYVAGTLNAAGGANTLTIANAASIAAEAPVESYVLNAGGTIDVTGNTDVDVDDGAGVTTTINVNGATVSGTYALAGAGDQITLTNGADISGINGGAATTAETLNVTGAVTMTAAQHTAITAGGVADQVTFTTAASGITLDGDIETYVLANATNSVTLGNLAQNVTGGTGNDTIDVAALHVTGTLDGGAGTDTIFADGSADLTGATLTSIEQLEHDSAAIVTINDSQFGSFTDFLGGLGTNRVVVADNNTAITATLDSDVEQWDFDNDDDNELTVSSSSISSVQAGAGDDVVYYDATLGAGLGLDGEGSVGGANALGDTGDTLALEDGANISGGTIAGFEQVGLADGGSFTVNAAQHNGITLSVGAGYDASGTETLTISDAITGTDVDAVENYVLSANDDDFTFTQADADATLRTVDLGGGADTLTINNATIEATEANDYVTVSNFQVGDDSISSQVAGTAHNSAYQTITSGGSNLTVGANSIVEIETDVATAITLTDVTDGGGIESLIASAVADSTSAGTNDLTFVVYDGSGNAGLYQANITTSDADLNTADFGIELVGVFDGIGADALTAGNFA
ncbi:DUF4214 domain-containing protein [Billgrantia azerbaijanica]|nr:DUF4214 domain-containing protein [Halomonas azerbaijanica]